MTKHRRRQYKFYIPKAAFDISIIPQKLGNIRHFSPVQVNTPSWSKNDTSSESLFVRPMFLDTRLIYLFPSKTINKTQQNWKQDGGAATKKSKCLWTVAPPYKNTKTIFKKNAQITRFFLLLLYDDPGSTFHLTCARSPDAFESWSLCHKKFSRLVKPCGTSLLRVFCAASVAHWMRLFWTLLNTIWLKHNYYFEIIV